MMRTLFLALFLAATLLLLALPAHASFPVVAAENTSTEGANTTSHTVNLPTGIASGDLLLVFFACDGDSAANVSFPAGWTEIFDSGDTTTVILAVGYRIADGSEGTTITVTTDAAERSAHRSLRITNWHGTTAPEVSTGASGSSASPDPDSLSPTWGAEDTLWFALGANDRGVIAVNSYPTNYTNGVLVQSTNASFGASLESAQRELNAASEDPGNFVMDASWPWMAATVAVRPSGAPPPAAPRRRVIVID